MRVVERDLVGFPFKLFCLQQIAKSATQRVIDHSSILLRESVAFVMGEHERLCGFPLHSSLFRLHLHDLHSLLLLYSRAPLRTHRSCVQRSPGASRLDGNVGVPYTPRISGAHINLCICNWTRMGSRSANTHSARRRGSRDPNTGLNRTGQHSVNL